MIVARTLVKSFAGQPVLRDVSLTLDDGALVVLTGPSGAGKTTLLRLLAGLDQPDGGVIEVDGALANRPAACLAPHRRSIGFVFQSPTLWPHMTLAANVAFALPTGSRRERHTAALALLDAVGIADLGARYPGQVSLGQAHRAALARALAPEPRHLFLDEPLANLDAPSRAGLLELIKAQISTRQTAALFVTHDRDDIRRLGGRVVELRDGRLETLSSGGGG